jgi:hypothetical protein
VHCTMTYMAAASFFVKEISQCSKTSDTAYSNPTESLSGGLAAPARGSSRIEKSLDPAQPAIERGHRRREVR